VTKSHKFLRKTKLAGIVEVGSEKGFRIALMPNVETSISDAGDLVKIAFIRTMLNNIEANLLIDLGLAEVDEQPT
jgi:hypothetical protein